MEGSHVGSQARSAPSLGLAASRPCSAAFAKEFMSSSIMSRAGSSCLNSRSGSRPQSSRMGRPGTAQSGRLRGMARPMSRRQRKLGNTALTFDELFTQSFSRAAKRMASERKEGLRPGTALRDRKQYRSLHRWWTMAELKVAEEAAAHHVEDDSDASSSFGDDQSASRPKPTLHARRMSIEALLESRRRNSLRLASTKTLEEAPEALETPVRPRKYKRARGMTIDIKEISDPDLVELLQVPTEEEVSIFLEDPSKAEEFTEKEIAHLRKAFVKHRSAYSPEVHMDDLPQILDYLGFLKLPDEKITSFVSQITKFSTLEFDEFVSFMLLARAYDLQQVSSIFKRFDADGSGELSAEELEDVLKSLHITPFRSTIAGALAVVDSDDSGTLDYTEFVQLLLIYRKTEGFAETEIMKLYRIFQRFAELQDDGRYTLHYSLSSKALMEMFGSQTALLASRLGSALPRPPSQGDEEAKRLKRAEGMTLREFLIWSRRLREAEVEWYRQEFERADVDHGGYLDEDEIRLVLQCVGYTPLRAVILDLIESVNPLKGNVMDFDEFVEMMEIFRTQNGFTRKEVQEFKQSFEMFDTDQSEEVDVIQVGGILRSLGISAELGQVQALVKTVDWNGSNSLDFNEFLRLMRLQREDELARVKVIFDAAADARVTDAGDVKVTIEPNQMISVFRKLGYPESVGKSTLDLFLKMIREPLDFDALVLLVDSCRRMNMQKMRKQASFTDDAVERFRLLFNSLDSDGSGEIDKRELVAFCKDRGLPLATKKDQEQLLNFINEARSTALRSGVSLADCGPEKSPAVKFWVFIHLQRILQTHQDKLRATELRSTAGNNFSQAEVDELSYVFAQGVAAESKRGDEEATLSLTGLWSVLDKLGVRLTPIEKEEVKVKLFMDAGNVLDLPAFIRVVGWLAAAKQSSANLSIKR